METYRGYTLAHEGDSNGHFNVQYYTQKYDQASGQMLSKIGFDYTELASRNLGFAYLESTIRYMKEVMIDTGIHIESQVISIKGKVVTVRHEMKHSVTMELHSTCVMKWVIFDKELRKAVPLSDELREKLESLIVQND